MTDGGTEAPGTSAPKGRALILTGDQNLSDVSFVQWLGLVVFMGAAYGITYRVPKEL